MEAEYLTFQPLYMERVWGGRKLATLFDRNLPTKSPIGESWELVDRPDAQSTAREGRFCGTTLHELWIGYREELFGDAYLQARFPLLIKILDASRVLSVQVHPPPHRTIGLLEEPKTELWYFIHTEEGAGIYVGLKKGVDRKDFRAALANGNVEELLHRLPTRPETFMFLPSGRLHAIDAGNVLFEVQQNSDTTYRVFDWNRVGLDGRPRTLHIEQSLQCIDFEDFEPALGETPAERLVGPECFTVERWFLDRPRMANEVPRFSVFQVVRGVVSFAGIREFRFGDLFMVPAHSHRNWIASRDGTGVVLRSTL
jgi:mannose-6-phosphate isomerase